MIYALLPEATSSAPRQLPFYLAMEEYLARYFEGEYFFMWQVNPTVIFGRNQRMESEVNLEFCQNNGIELCRRKSGGGCVYADQNNIMFSHITTCSSVATTFSDFTERVAQLLRKMGIAEAHTTGRNDIMIDDRKVSGYAFYHIHLANRLTHSPEGRAIVHGTMLYDADTDTMNKALTPSRLKLQAKGVKSVRSRVTTIKEHSTITMPCFKKFVREHLCHSVLELNRADIEAITEISRFYQRPEWLGAPSKQSVASQQSSPQRVDGIGEFYISLHRTADAVPRIRSIDLAGDFFITGDIDRHIIEPLCGCELTHSALMQRLGHINLCGVIPNLQPNQLADLIMEAHTQTLAAEN